MKKHLLLWALFAFIVNILSAAELPLDSFFRQVGKNGRPRQWTLHQWSGYRPYADMKVRKNGDGKKNILTLRKVNGKYGSSVISVKRFAVRAGDSIRVMFRARGKGAGSTALHYYTLTNKYGQWNRCSEGHQFNLTPQWTTHIYNFTVTNGPNDETGKFAVSFGASRGSELDLSSVQVEHTPSPYRGDIKFPRTWTVFAPIDRNFTAKPEDLRVIPKKLAGVSPRKMQRVNGVLDFRKLLGPGANKCGWVYAEVKSPVDADCTIGAGADWWMQVFVNGAIVFDTMAKGNRIPDAMDNFTKTIRLKKGKNIIAVRMITGLATGKLHIGGPADLRSMKTAVKLSKVGWIEDFDGKKISCSGKPVIIQDHPTPGLLSLTGQGVFRTSSVLEIKPPRTTLEIPDKADNGTALGVRVQNFGKKRLNGTLALVCDSVRGRFETRLLHRSNSANVAIEFALDKKVLSRETIPYKVLPADILFTADTMGNYTLTVNSLADSSIRTFRGSSAHFKGLKKIDVRLELRAGNRKPATVTLDNFLTGTSVLDTGKIYIPYKVDIPKTFDPVKAGWKLVLQDDFNGSKLDLSKWFYSPGAQKDRLAVRDGKLIITADWNKRLKRVTSAGIHSNKKFLYGYFETRVKFRKESGWWAAFWLCTIHPCNSFIDGLEIDIFEDYYLSAKTPGGKPGDTLDHNLHLYTNNGLKSWNYNSKLPGKIDDFYTIGCKWTPFEISYYMNGKLIRSQAYHSPYDGVVFDAFHHGTGIVPLHAIFSGCCGRSAGDPSKGRFPDQFEVDYVRIYEYPNEDKPQIKMTISPEDQFMLPLGSVMKVKADVKPSKISKAPIACVYLMDSGFTLDYKTRPPYEFDVKLTKEYYDATQYVKPGRSGAKFVFHSGVQAYSVVAQDVNGKVAFAKPVLRFIHTPGKSTPYRGKMAQIPGTIVLSDYDEGGEGNAYHDTDRANRFNRNKKKPFRPGESVDALNGIIGHLSTGEWLNYTVNVKKSGTYRAKLNYGTPADGARGIILLVNGRAAGEFHIKGHDMSKRYAISSVAEISDIKLAAGTNKLTLLILRGGVNCTKLNFELQK